MSYTKGPWRVEEGTTVIWGACNPDDNSTYGMGYPIADGRTMFGYIPSLRSHREDEAEANARLIAAAPDLLLALEDCVALLEVVKEHWIDYDMVFTTGVNDAKECIEKAKGEVK